MLDIRLTNRLSALFNTLIQRKLYAFLCYTWNMFAQKEPCFHRPYGTFEKKKCWTSPKIQSLSWWWLYQYLVPIINKEDDNDHNGHIGNDDIHDVFSGWVYIYLIMKMSRKFIFILNLDFVFFDELVNFINSKLVFDVFSINFKLIWTRKNIHQNKYDRWIITGSFLSFKKFVWKGNFFISTFLLNCSFVFDQ